MGSFDEEQIMTTRIRIGAILIALIVLMTIPVTASESVQIISVATLPNLPLAQVQQIALPGAPISNDRGILLGGIGSDLYHMPGTPENEFWAVTDRGPNGEVEVNGDIRSTAYVPEFTPMIMKLVVINNVITPVTIIPITTKNGKPVTGLPNREGPDPRFWDATGTKKLPFNPNGLDVEGMVRTTKGEFWIADEYSPSLVHVNARGNVIARYVPKGVNLRNTDYPVIEALPAAYALRKGNRGFEGISLSEDEKTLFIALQSPLSAPDKVTGDRARSTRILKFDVPSKKVTGEYVYRLEVGALFDPRPKMKQTEMKISAIAAIDAQRALVLERTDWAFAVYRIDFADATNIAGSVWSTTNKPISLEFFAWPSDVAVTPVSKTLVFHSASLRAMPEKVEGLAIINATTLAIANDNDFDVGAIGPDGMNQGTQKKSYIITLRVPDIAQ
jgi:hypothetical protein